MKIWLKILLTSLIGAAIGYGYYYFVGCNSGGCPITSNWHSSVFVGAMFGFFWSLPLEKKSGDDSGKSN